ncbi:reticulocyte-binding protein homolog 2a [Nematostella vectensis]|uniref:reticulocyte-binding protein homolog 2a n=1 Tax=Nematostella vectensis TaxID=45351 RepID=UPI0020775AFF|nr:reticulocyte-binding protein homolog 2a [Nematostella vectensis]
MSVPAVFTPATEESRKTTHKLSKKLLSANSTTTHSKKISKAASLKKKQEEERAAKERQEKLLKLYELWHQVKHEEREDRHGYLKDKVTLQHALIQQQDELYKVKQSRLHKQQQQIKKTQLLARQERNKRYSKFVHDVLAEEKLKSRSLKSHTRVISSHQPIRMPRLSISETPTRSRETRASVSRTSADGTVGESILLADNFNDLINESVEVQLQALLGPEAEAFLKPTFREGAKKCLDPLVHKHRGMGAHDLWGLLRGKSQKKLEKQEDSIPTELKNAYRSFLRECVHANIPVFERSFIDKNKERIPEDQLSESHLIKDIHFALHRLDLMYRVAHMNKDKTRLLFKNMESADANEGTVRPPRYNPNQIQPRKALPAVLSLSDFETWPPFLPNVEEEECFVEQPYVLDGEKITFLTEEMATCKGGFSARHHAPGIASKQPAPKTETTTLAKSIGNNIRGTVSAPVTAREDGKSKKMAGKSWQPLSLNALLDYKPPVRLLGSGEFRAGQQPRKWKID